MGSQKLASKDSVCVFLLLVFLVPCLGLYYACEKTANNFIAENNTIYAMLLLPENNSYLASISKVASVIKLTFDEIHKRDLLPGWTFNISTKDTGCDAYGVWSAIEAYIEKPIDVFFGPYCDYVVAPVARMIKFMQIPLVTAGALAYDFSRYDKTDPKAEYHMLVRTGWSFAGVAYTLEKIFDNFNWHQSNLIYVENGREEVLKDHYCSLAIQGVYQFLQNKRNCSVQSNKLPFYTTTEELKTWMKKIIGVDYASE
ncbi:ANF_receptor domain-containing protein [Trichonephila inaurata madagascariensis]|uniref:ANF_receptor domain-containing protein n=1 Tax=Trichonephila inaurata madagascariensis TaxID=2747483 RepID=A0A8X6XR22_9ARAC|nr:ANF_receptor domain-containing protein [Trichonephila inaurata madagascariensis]